MNKERELLRRAYELLDRRGQVENFDKRQQLLFDIHTYFSTTSDDAEEPVAWMFPDDIERFQTEETFAQAFSVKCGSPTQGTTLPLYLHPPKPAEPEAETIETLKAENFKLASGQCTEGGPWGDEGGTPYCKYAARKLMTEEEIDKAIGGIGNLCVFKAGIRFAEKHHGIGGDDES